MVDKYDNTNNLMLLKKYAVPIAVAVSVIFVTLLILDFEEENIRAELYQNQIEIQQAVTNSIAKNISTELKLIFLELDILANSKELQEDFQSEESLSLLNTAFAKINQITPTSVMLLTNDGPRVVAEMPSQADSFVGTTIGGFGITNAASSLRSEISSWIDSESSDYQLAVIHPIIDQNENLKGMLILSIPAEEFFSRHGNLYDIDSRFLVSLDSQHRFVTSPNTSLIGEDFYGDSTQEFFDHDESFYSHYVNIFNGNPDSAIYNIGNNEVIDTGSPILLDNKYILSVFVITQTSSLVDRIDEIMIVNKMITISMLSIIAITLILLFLRRTQTLEKEKLTIIGQLASNIAHDMRNPLGTIKGSVRIIKKQNTQGDKITNNEIERINRSIQRMSRQVEQVLNYIRNTPVNLENTSVRELLQNSLDVIDIPDNIAIVSPKSVDDAILECDPQKLEVVFVNILINAIHAIGKEKGKITIRITRETKDSISIEFENSGPSIPDDDLARVFDPLFTTKLTGTGLGLSGCKNIIEQHGGSIKVKPNPVIFTITLPKSQKTK